MQRLQAGKKLADLRTQLSRSTASDRETLAISVLRKEAYIRCMDVVAPIYEVREGLDCLSVLLQNAPLETLRSLGHTLRIDHDHLGEGLSFLLRDLRAAMFVDIPGNVLQFTSNRVALIHRVFDKPTANVRLILMALKANPAPIERLLPPGTFERCRLHQKFLIEALRVFRTIYFRRQREEDPRLWVSDALLVPFYTSVSRLQSFLKHSWICQKQLERSRRNPRIARFFKNLEHFERGVALLVEDGMSLTNEMETLISHRLSRMPASEIVQQAAAAKAIVGPLENTRHELELRQHEQAVKKLEYRLQSKIAAAKKRDLPQTKKRKR